jgi:dephospho-CoA kinase
VSKSQAKLIIGLTGNIACGKSTVGRLLEKLGAHVIDADVLAHRVLEEPEVRASIRSTFGPEVFTSQGKVDRTKLGKIVFAAADKMALLERIVHPRVLQLIDEIVEGSERQVIVIDAIKLLESSLASRCRQIWVVTCPQEIQLRRLMEIRGMSYDEALMRVRAQPPQEEKVRAATVVIDGSRSLEEAERQVAEAWRKFIEPELAPLSESL